MSPAKAHKKKNGAKKKVLTGHGAYHAKTVRRNPTKKASGRGAYSMNDQDSFGKRWGGYLGSMAGETLGGAAQNLFKAVTGLGAYSVRRNVFMEGRLPEVMNIPKGGGTVIRFQEYLGDVITAPVAGNFQLQSFTINAANPISFPFLSQIAANFEQYDFEGILYSFCSTSSDALNSVNTALGSVMMATQYDINDALFASKLEMLNYEYSSIVKPSENCIHMIECDPRQTSINELYTLYGQAVPANSDSRLYNLGRFNVATQGFQGTSVNVGQLHVTYQVRLLKPKLFTSLGLGIPMYCSTIIVGSAYSNAAPLGTTPSLASSLLIQSNTANVTQSTTTLTFNNQNTAKLAYMVTIKWRGSAVVLAAPTITVTGGSYGAVADNGTIVSPVGGSTAGEFMQQILFQTDGLGVVPSIAIGGAGTLPSSGAAVIVRIVQYDPSEGVLLV